MSKDYKIKEIEEIEGVNYSEYESVENKIYSLPQWYSNIRKYNVSKLSIDDLARFIRQGMFLKYIVRETIKRLFNDPFAGALYDGELVNMISNRIDKLFWMECEELSCKAKDLIAYIESKRMIDKFDWLSNEDRIEYAENIEKLKSNINS